jgi:hypothetical protein
MDASVAEQGIDSARMKTACRHRGERGPAIFFADRNQVGVWNREVAGVALLGGQAVVNPACPFSLFIDVGHSCQAGSRIMTDAREVDSMTGATIRYSW